VIVLDDFSLSEGAKEVLGDVLDIGDAEERSDMYQVGTDKSVVASGAQANEGGVSIPPGDR
jgi:hypothetical protein